jgi:O-antigen ligase
VFYLLVPGIGREQAAYHHGALTGVFVQRNSAAFVLAVAVLTFIFMAAQPGSRRSVSSVVWTLVAFVTLVATESGTGLAVTVVSGVAMILVLFMRRLRPWIRWSAALVVLVTVGAVALSAQTGLTFVSDLLGRDETLTGRTVIWGAVEPYVQARPWLGYGWAALWTEASLVTRAMWAVAGFPFPHAHNAYLDTMAQSGIIGLVLVMLVCGSVILRAGARVLSPEGDVWAAWPLVTTVFLLLYGISEQSFTSYFGWLVLVAASAFARPDEFESVAVGRSGEGAMIHVRGRG